MKVGGICGDCNKYYQGESCPKCKSVSSGETVNVILDIPAHFNRGLGEYVESRSDYRVKLREKGMIEVGNEKKYVDPERGRKQREQARDKAIESVRPEAYKILSHYEGAPQWN